MEIEFTAEDWRQQALRLAGQLFDLQVTVIALQRQLAEAQANGEKAEAE